MNAKRIRLTLLVVAMMALSFTLPVARASLSQESLAQRAPEPPDPQAAPIIQILRGNHNLVGTFIGTADAPGVGSYVLIETFHDDGTCEATTTIDLAPPSATAPRGEWKRIGHNHYLATYVGGLINSPTDPTFAGAYRITEDITTNDERNEISGQSQVDIFDPNGTLVFSFNGTGTTHRLTVGSTQEGERPSRFDKF